jgi:maltose-binding protein MalE
MDDARLGPASRRSFLSRAGLVGGGLVAGGLAAACGGPGGAPAGQTEATQGVADIRVLTSNTFLDAMVQPATDVFNEQNQGKANVKVEQAPEGWDTKTLAMVREKSVLWSSFAVDSFFNLYQRIVTGMAQPLDPYIQSSTVPGAKDFKSKYISPVVYDSGLFKGKFYMMPTKLNMTITPYNVEFVHGAGYETVPETWDEVRVMLRKIKDKYAKDDVWPTDVNLDLWRTIGGVYCSLIDKPYDAEGMVKLDSPEWYEALDLLKSFYTDKLANPAFLGTPDGQSTWQKGKIAVIWNYPSWLNIATTAWGFDAYTATNMTRKAKGGPNRTWLHVDGTYLMTNAPHPQQTVNWILTMLGPEGKGSEVFAAGTISRSGSPMYKAHVESSLIKGNNNYPWLYNTYKMVDQSTAAPLSPLHFLVDAKGKKYLPAYFKGEMSAKEAVAKMKEEIQKDKGKMLAGQG